MRQLDNLRHIGESLSLLNNDQEILEITLKYVKLHYPKNKHRRSWAKANILLFCNNRKEKLRCLRGVMNVQ